MADDDSRVKRDSTPCHLVPSDATQSNVLSPMSWVASGRPTLDLAPGTLDIAKDPQAPLTGQSLFCSESQTCRHYNRPLLPPKSRHERAERASHPAMSGGEGFKRSSSGRLLAAAVALVAISGCGGHRDDDDDPVPPSGAAVVFFDDFSGSFPGSRWDVLSGDPFTSHQEGNAAPSLILNPVDDSILVRGDFVFTSETAVTLAFDMASFEVQSGSEFRFLVVANRKSVV